MPQIVIAATTIVALLTASSVAAVSPFVESFDGDGMHSLENGDLVGFANPGWRIDGKGSFFGQGLLLESDGTVAPPFHDGEMLGRSVFGSGSFVDTVVIADPTVELTDAPVGSAADISLTHFLSTPPGHRLQIGIFVEGEDLSEWTLRTVVGEGIWFQRGILAPEEATALSISYNERFGSALFSYDNDIRDGIPPVHFGPIDYEGEFNENRHEVALVSSVDVGKSSILVDSWTLQEQTDGPPGDFTRDGVLDGEDIDSLNAAIGSELEAFDLNGDFTVDELDRNIWVHDLAKTWFGDSNLDGEFNSSDMVIVFQAGTYDDSIQGNSSWATGDWNGDEEFNSRDLVFAFQDGGFELGPRVGTHSVPEPALLLFDAIIMACLLVSAKRRHCQSSWTM